MFQTVLGTLTHLWNQHLVSRIQFSLSVRRVVSENWLYFPAVRVRERCLIWYIQMDPVLRKCVCVFIFILIRWNVCFWNTSDVSNRDVWHINAPVFFFICLFLYEYFCMVWNVDSFFSDNLKYRFYHNISITA